MTIKQIKKDIKGIFKLPVKQYYFGKVTHGTPYFYPWSWNKTIISINKVKPKYRANPWTFKFLGYYWSIGSPIWIRSYDLGWKDKYGTPRFEWSPAFHIFFFNLQFCYWYVAPNGNYNDGYWEQVLWYLKYSNKDIKKAEDTWGWVNYKTKESSWNKNYLI